MKTKRAQTSSSAVWQPSPKHLQLHRRRQASRRDAMTSLRLMFNAVYNETEMTPPFRQSETSSLTAVQPNHLNQAQRVGPTNGVKPTSIPSSATMCGASSKQMITIREVVCMSLLGGNHASAAYRPLTGLSLRFSSVVVFCSMSLHRGIGRGH